MACEDVPRCESRVVAVTGSDHNELWHVKMCHGARVVSWLLQEVTTTSSDFMKIPRGVLVVTLYSHDAM